MRRVCEGAERLPGAMADDDAPGTLVVWPGQVDAVATRGEKFPSRAQRLDPSSARAWSSDCGAGAGEDPQTGPAGTP